MATSQNQEHPNHDFNQVLAHFFQAEQARLDEAKKQLRDEIIPRLREHNVVSVEAAYSGYGDSGAIDGVQYRDSAGQRVDRTTIPSPIVEHLETCLYEFLPAGFEINDGGQGTVLIDTRTAQVTLRHQENYTESRDSTREFAL